LMKVLALLGDWTINAGNEVAVVVRFDHLMRIHYGDPYRCVRGWAAGPVSAHWSLTAKSAVSIHPWLAGTAACVPSV
jgi:hypothetical protein